MKTTIETKPVKTADAFLTELESKIDLHYRTAECDKLKAEGIMQEMRYLLILISGYRSDASKTSEPMEEQ
jgi:hypothetical protein